MTAESVRQAITPLRMIFWGGILCVFDFTITSTHNAQGLKFDFLNDALGTFLIALGVFRLGSIQVHDRYAGAMRFVQVVSVVAVLDAIREHFVMPLPPAVSFVISVLGFINLVAVIVFCVAMRWFCEQAQLHRSLASWRLTTMLFVVIYLLPLGFFYLAAAWAIATGNSLQIDLGPAALLVLPVFAVPLIHLFVSTSRMRHEAETLYEAEPFDGSVAQAMAYPADN
jgi:hypothetical protein